MYYHRIHIPAHIPAHIPTHTHTHMFVRAARHILIAQAPTAGTAAAPTAAGPSAVAAARKLVATPELETAHFECLGAPATVCLINAPPSVPLLVKRRGLLLLYGDSPANVRSLVRWLRRGAVALAYQHLVLTTPFLVLVTPPRPDQLFATVIVDGQVDWAVVAPELLAVYTGNSLHVALAPLPRPLRSWAAHRYHHVLGRGQLALAGHGLVYRVNVGAGELLLVNKGNLVAVTTAGPADLALAFAPVDVVQLHVPGTDTTVSTRVAAPEAPRGLTRYLRVPAMPQMPLWAVRAWATVKRWLGAAASTASDAAVHGENWLVGTRQFVRVHGPRTLLLQLSAGVSQVERWRMPQLDFATGKLAENPVPAPPVMARQPQDYLNVVTIAGGKGQVALTPDFSEKVAEIKKKE